MTQIQVKKTLNAAEGEMLLNVDLQLPPRQLIGLYGKSGAGKTSLLRILAGLFSPDEAQIIVNNKTWIDTRKGILLSPQKRKVGLVFQDYALFPNMTVRKNLLFALSKGQSPEMVEELIELSELGDLQHQLPPKLSGGQQQRVALARALVQRPELLLLDEPLSALDQEMREKLQQYLLRVHQAYGLTTILISHNQEEIEKMADWVVVLDAGKVVKQGKVEDVFDNVAPEQLITLKGTLIKTEHSAGGTLLTIENGDNVWRVLDDEVREYQIGEDVRVELEAKEVKIAKK
ncbi:ATP-binding cassette domain-containing protein [Lewinella cohaerens]|uniref:ATP-binding cassette domain-containing protein n=1 Tax=Lewinella cohaerens TaxID=70995 RepID=UPI000375C315|nr:ATP-binding cassette domain-containing protein [Lewinella cohaerens]